MMHHASRSFSGGARVAPLLVLALAAVVRANPADSPAASSGSAKQLLARGNAHDQALSGFLTTHDGVEPYLSKFTDTFAQVDLASPAREHGHRKVVEWLGLAVTAQDTADYSAAMRQFHESLKGNSQGIAAVLADPAYRKSLEAHPPARNAAINLIHRLDVSNDVKEGLYRLEIARGLELDAQGKPTVKTTHVTNAMLLYSMHITDKRALRQIINEGLAANPDPAARAEFLLRVKTYFPGVTP